MTPEPTHSTHDTDEPSESAIAWSMLDLDELVEAYWSRVAPAMTADGMDPEADRPTHQWLSPHGFRGLIYALRTYHDRSFGEFWAEDLGLQQESAYDWGIDHPQTIDLLESFLDSRQSRGNLSESSVATLRYRLGQYVRAYAAENDTGNLLAPVKPGADTAIHDATDAAWATFDRLDSELHARTTRRIHGAVDDWYAHLVRRNRAALNPVNGLDDEFGWSRGDAETVSNPALDPEHVQSLYRAAETAAEALLVVALCGWGLRSSEVASLHRSQLVFDDSDSDVPYVTFSERKNGPGEVSILFGADVAQRRLVEVADRREWNGYLFPSKRSDSGHITRQTVLNRFDSLASRADLPQKIDGRKTVPQMARRFWYDAYSATQQQLFEELEEIAAEQGSSSAGVVMRNYLSSDRRRALRRDAMRSQLAAAFDA